MNNGTSGMIHYCGRTLTWLKDTKYANSMKSTVITVTEQNRPVGRITKSHNRNSILKGWFVKGDVWNGYDTISNSEPSESDALDALTEAYVDHINDQMYENHTEWVVQNQSMQDAVQALQPLSDGVEADSLSADHLRTLEDAVSKLLDVIHVAENIIKNQP